MGHPKICGSKAGRCGCSRVAEQGQKHEWNPSHAVRVIDGGWFLSAGCVHVRSTHVVLLCYLHYEDMIQRSNEAQVCCRPHLIGCMALWT